MLAEVAHANGATPRQVALAFLVRHRAHRSGEPPRAAARLAADAVRRSWGDIMRFQIPCLHASPAVAQTVRSAYPCDPKAPTVDPTTCRCRPSARAWSARGSARGRHTYRLRRTHLYRHRRTCLGGTDGSTNWPERGPATNALMSVILFSCYVIWGRRLWRLGWGTAMDSTALQALIAEVRGTAAALAEAEKRVASATAELAQGPCAQPAQPRTPIAKRGNSGWVAAG